MIDGFQKKHPLTVNFPFITFKAELKVAKRYADNKLPADVVKLNSKLEIRNTKTGVLLPVQVVLPLDEELIKYKLSVFSSVGMALLGRQSGKTVRCFKSDGKTSLKILSVV